MADRSTLTGLLQDAARRADPARDGLTFIDLRERETFFDWATLARRAAAAAGTLRAAGLRPGERVAIVAPTEVGFIDAFFGALWAGGVPVPLYPPVRLGRLTEYLDRTAAMLAVAEAAVVVVEARVARLFGGVLERHRPRLGSLPLADLHQGAPIAAHPAKPTELGLIQFSSGTTAAPKGVALTHAAILENLDRIMDLLPGDQRQAGVSWLPLYHDMGLIGCLFPALHRPGPLALISPELFLARPALWLRAISRHRATATTAPSFAYALCAQRIPDEELVGVDLSSLRVALNGAEPIAPGALSAFADRFAPHGLDPAALLPVYGLSEAALAVTFSPVGRGPLVRNFDPAALTAGALVPADGGAALVSVGQPLRGFSVEVRSGGDPLPAGQIGRIWVQGPSLLSGYLGGLPSPITDGWLDTGDLGAFVDGELYITGRAKDLIILRGRNHAPQTFERLVDAVPGVRVGCAVALALPSAEGEQLGLFVESHDPPPGLAEALRAAVLAESGVEAALVVILAPGTLPRTSSGKLRRAETLRQHTDGSLLPPEALGPWRLAGRLAESARGYWRSRRGAG